MDFKTQRKAVSAVEDFGKKYIIFYPVCILIRLLIAAFGSISRNVDMAFSDDRGRFLGMERRCSRHEKAERAKEKKLRRTEEKRIRRSEPRQRRGFFKRTLSAALSLAFAFMTMPAGLEIVSFAAAGDRIYAAAEGQLDLVTTYKKIQATDPNTGAPLYDTNNQPIMVDDLNNIDYVTLRGFNSTVTGTDGYAVYPDAGNWTRVGNSSNAISGVQHLKAIDLTKADEIGAGAFSGASDLAAIVVDAQHMPANVPANAFSGINSSCILYILNSSGNTNILNGFSGNTVCINDSSIDAKEIITGIVESSDAQPSATATVFTYPDNNAAGAQSAQLFISFTTNNNDAFDGAVITYNSQDYVCVRDNALVSGGDQIRLAENTSGEFTAIIPLREHSTAPGLSIRPFKYVERSTPGNYLTDMYGKRVMNYGGTTNINVATFVAAGHPGATLHVPNTGAQEPFLKFSGIPSAPVTGTDHMEHYVCIFYGAGAALNNDFIPINRSDSTYNLPDLFARDYTPYLLEIFDPLDTVNPVTLGASTNITEAINGKDETWHQCDNFSFRISQAKLDLEKVENVKIHRNGDSNDTMTFTWTASNKATGCYFYRYDANGNITDTYKYENPEPGVPSTNAITRSATTDSLGNYTYTFKLGDCSDGTDRGVIAPEDDVIYYDIVPYEKLPYEDERYGREYVGDKYINGENNGEHQLVYADHYILRTVSNFTKLRANEEPWIQLFWKDPSYPADHGTYQSGNNFAIKCYDADGNSVNLGSFANVTVSPDANGEYNLKLYMNDPSLRTDTDYTFTVSVSGFNETNPNDHYFTSRPAFAKAKNKPNHIGGPSESSNSSAARELISLTKGNTEFDIKWPEVTDGADAYRIDVYNVDQREASLADLDTKVANAPQMHVHSQVYPVTADALYGALTEENLIHVDSQGDYTVTIDRLNLLSNAYVKNGSSYMVVITAIKYGIGMNFNPVQVADPAQIPVENVDASTPEDYKYTNKYHYEIDSERVLSSDVVVPENILIMKKPHWFFEDEHIIQDRGIMLEWKTGNLSGVDGYIIERYVGDINTSYVPTNAKWTEIGTVEGASTESFVDTDYQTFYDNNIANNYQTRYWYRITPTYMQTATLATSAAVYFDLVPDVFKMTPPTPVWSQGEDESIVIEWQRDPLNNADAYNIYDANGNLYVNVYIPYYTDPSTGIDYFRFTDQKLDFDTLKRYTISSIYYAAAVDPGEYPPSSSRVLIESERAPIAGVSGILQAPLNLEYEADEDGNIILTWTGVSSADYYNVYYSVNGGRYTKVSVPPQFVLNANNLCYKRFNEFKKGDVCRFYVKSAKNISVNGNSPYNKEAESSATNELTVVVGVAIQTPTIKATPGDRRNLLEWSAVSNADGYELYQCDANGTNLRLLTSSPDLQYEHTGLVNKQTYYYCVRAYRYINGSPIYGSFSQVVSATTDVTYGNGESGPRYIATPIDFTVITSDGAADLSWSSVDGAEGYRVYMLTASGDYQLLGVTSSESIRYTGLTNGEIYTYTVTAYKTLADGEIVESGYATPRSVTVGNYLAAPVDLKAVAGNRTVTLTWTAVTGATGYVVYAYSSVSGTFTAVAVVSQPGFIHENLENGLTYTYMVTAYKQVGLSNQYSNYSIAVSAVPSADAGNNGNNNNGSNNNNGNNNNNNGTRRSASINIVGTLPTGISHSELISAYTDDLTFDQDIDIRFSVDTESSKIIYDTLNGYAEGLDSFDVYPFDISTYIAGTNTKIQPAEGHYLSITMPIPDSFRKYGENIQVMHVKSDGQMEILPLTFGEASGVPLVQFNCAEFSPFAFVHYYTAEDLRSGSGAAAAGGSGAASGSAYSIRFTSCGGFILRKRNRIYKLIKK